MSSEEPSRKRPREEEDVSLGQTFGKEMVDEFRQLRLQHFKLTEVVDYTNSQIHGLNQQVKSALKEFNEEKTVTIVDAQTLSVMQINKKNIARKTVRVNPETYGVTLELVMTDGPDLVFEGFEDVIEICEAVKAPCHFKKIVEERKYEKGGDKPVPRYNVQKQHPHYWFDTSPFSQRELWHPGNSHDRRDPEWKFWDAFLEPFDPKKKKEE